MSGIIAHSCKTAARLRVVPHFSSGIVERAKRGARENHPTGERRDAAGREKNHFSLSLPSVAFSRVG